MYMTYNMYLGKMNVITINKKEVTNFKVINEGSMGGFGEEMEGKEGCNHMIISKSKENF